MSPRFVFGRENVPCVAEVVNRSLKADCTDFRFHISSETKVEFFLIAKHIDVIFIAFLIQNVTYFKITVKSKVLG